MAENDFVVINPPGTNTLDQADYILTPEVTGGYVEGEAVPSPLFNKMWRQCSTIGALIAAFIVNATGQAMLDDGNIAEKLPYLAAAISGGMGQCRLSVAAGNELLLSPYNGNLLTINGVPCAIPAGGVQLSNAGLVASTLYYIYAEMLAGVMTLIASTTPYAITTGGWPVENGDVTKTLVGMIYTTTSTPGQFVDSVSQRLCANWFNRSVKKCRSANAATVSTASGPTVDLTPGEHVEFLVWGSTCVEFGLAGQISIDTAANFSDTFIGLDGIATPAGGFTTQVYMGAANEPYLCTYGPVTDIIAEGHHYVTLAGSTTGSGAVASWDSHQVTVVPTI